MQRAPRGEPGGRAPVRPIDQVVDGVERQRQELDVQGLHLAEAHQRVGVEGIGQAGDDAGPPAPGPALDHDWPSPARSARSRQEEDVVDGHRRPAEREQRQSHHALRRPCARRRRASAARDRRCWRRRGASGSTRQLVGHPGQDPRVQRRVGVVEPRPGGQPGGQRPGVHDGQRARTALVGPVDDFVEPHVVLLHQRAEELLVGPIRSSRSARFERL